MYSYEARMRAVRLYIKYDRRPAATVRELGYSSRGMLRSWYREFDESGDLHQDFKRRPRYSNEEQLYMLKEAQVLLEQRKRHYNTGRLQNSLGCRPPGPETGSPAPLCPRLLYARLLYKIFDIK